MKTLRFREWRTTYGVELSLAQRDTLRQQFGATVEPTVGSTSVYDVTPGNTIGAIEVQGATLLVEPKIPIRQVLFLLGYASNPSAWRSEEASLGTTDDLVEGIVALYTNLAERALRRGLLYGYHEVDADLQTVRGRINLAEQLRRRPGLELPLAVRFTEHDEDILENRLLLAGAQMVKILPLRDPTTRRSLHRILDSLQFVSLQHFPRSQVPTVTWTRLNQHYRPAVELARLLLSLRSPDLRPGATGTAALTFDMADLFEEFVRTALREALGVRPEQFPSGDDCPRLNLDSRGRIRLKPDLSYWPSSRCVFIGDVKYKRDSGSGRSDDLYQLLAYAAGAQLPDATLFYAQGPSEPQEHQIPQVGIRLRVHHVDLSQEPLSILDQLNRFSAEIPASPNPAIDAA